MKLGNYLHYITLFKELGNGTCPKPLKKCPFYVLNCWTYAIKSLKLVVHFCISEHKIKFRLSIRG